MATVDVVRGVCDGANSTGEARQNHHQRSLQAHFSFRKRTKKQAQPPQHDVRKALPMQPSKRDDYIADK